VRRLLIALAAALILLITFANACVLALGRSTAATAAGVASFVIVPGAAVDAAGVPSPVLEDRLVCARDAFRAGRARRILVSGDALHADHDEVGAMRRWLVSAGVPDDAIDSDPAGYRTRATMERAARVFGVRDALVCTQAFHLARSLFLARRAGIQATGAAAAMRGALVANHAREIVARTFAFCEAYLVGPVR
jgi:SanA protein